MPATVSHSHYFGVQRFWKDFEDIPILLMDAAGNEETGVAIGDVTATLVKPDGTVVDYFGSSPHADSWTEIGNGVYLLRLWGDHANADATTEQALDTVGTYGIHLRQAGGAFEPIVGTYQVRHDFDLRLTSMHIPGSAGSDKYRALLSIHRWWDHVRVTPGDPDLTAVNLLIRDRVGTTLVNINQGDPEYSVSFEAIHYEFQSLGVTESGVLNQRVTITYKGFVYTMDKPIASRFGA